MPAARRSYQQYCAIAYGLDVIGERWALLIVRELLLGPKRFKDLFEALPGIATNLLTQRLRDLELAGVVERAILPPPAASAVYRLTPLGEELEPVARAISRWGSHFITREPREDESIPPNAYMLALRSTFRSKEAGGLARTFEVRLGERVFGVDIEQGKCTTWEGVPDDPDLSIATEVRTFSRLLWHRITTREALANGKVVIGGNPADLELFVRVFAHR
jgi:DNA-binding HxlR family transcriptional regulator